MARVVVVGGGVGGTVVANRLARKRRPDLEIVVVDGHGDHLYQPGSLHIPFEGEKIPLVCDEKELLRPEVRLLVERVEVIDRERRRVRFESGEGIDYDWLVLATGARLDHDQLPGGREANHQYHCRRGANRLRQELSDFGGGRIVVGAASLPYKCPPSALEFTFLLDDWLRERRLRDSTELTYVYPLEDILPDIYGPISRMMRPLLEERGVKIVTSFPSVSIDVGKRRLKSNGRDLPFDLLILVPPHKVAPYLRGTGFLDDDGWVKTDRSTLRAGERIYAIGDTTNLPRPKSGSAAHFMSDVAAENVFAEFEGREPDMRYDGRVTCFLETGRKRATILDFRYDRPPRPKSPSRRAYWQKLVFARFYFKLIRRF